MRTSAINVSATGVRFVIAMGVLSMIACQREEAPWVLERGGSLASRPRPWIASGSRTGRRRGYT
jgi:hypothetical protein